MTISTTMFDDLEAAARRGAEGVVVVALGADDLAVRERAIALAAAHLPPHVLVDLVQRTDEVGLRNAALDALERQGARASRALTCALAVADPRSALFLIEVVGRIGDRAVGPALFGLVDHADPNVAAAAILSLAALRCRDAVPRIIAALDGPPWVALAAAHALDCLGDPRARVALAARSGDDALGQLATAALAQLELVDPAAPSDEQLARLADDLAAPEPAIRAAALDALVGLPHLARVLDAVPPSIRLEMIEAIGRSSWPGAAPLLRGRLGVPGPERLRAIAALGRLRDRQAVAGLVGLCPDARPCEKLEIVIAVVRIGGPEVVDFLATQVADPDVDVRRAAADGLARHAADPELAHLAALAVDPDAYLRGQAAWGLGGRPSAASRALLARLLDDADPSVARAARQAWPAPDSPGA